MLRRLIGWIVFEVQYLSFIYVFIINVIILPTNDEIFMNSCKLIFVNVKSNHHQINVKNVLKYKRFVKKE